MNVQVGLLEHPKYRAFEADLKRPDAIKYLLRLWGACQVNRRGENWGKGITPEYVEELCWWKGTKGRLWEALTRERFGRPGWALVTEDGEFVVVAWLEHNRRLIADWKNGGKGGRPKNPSKNENSGRDGNPVKTQLKPTGNPEGTHANPRITHSVTSHQECDVTGTHTQGTREVGSSGESGEEGRGSVDRSDYEWPTREEWMAAAECEGLLEEWAREEWENQERKPPVSRWAKVDRSRLRYHAAWVRRQHEKRHAPGGKSGRAAEKNGAAARIGVEKQLAEVRRRIEEHVVVAGGEPTVGERMEFEGLRMRERVLAEKLGELVEVSNA